MSNDKYEQFTIELAKPTEMQVGGGILLNCPDDQTRLHKVLAMRDMGDYYEMDVELLLKPVPAEQSSTSDVLKNPERGTIVRSEPESSSEAVVGIRERRYSAALKGIIDSLQAEPSSDDDALHADMEREAMRLTIVELQQERDALKLTTVSGAFIDVVHQQVLRPAVCGIAGHFWFQENGGNCMMCQRERRAASNMKAALVERVREKAREYQGVANRWDAHARVEMLPAAKAEDERMRDEASAKYAALVVLTTELEAIDLLTESNQKSE